MRVDEFLVERWMNRYENDVEVNMAETCVQPFTIREFLEFVGRPEFFEEIMDTQLTYGYIEGNPELRQGIADLYHNCDPEDILVTGGAIEANFNAFYTLVEPGDTVISVFSTYQQLFSVAKGFGARVKYLCLHPEEKWLPDIEELKKLVDQETRMIVLNNPHNPTGSLIDEKLLRGICELAEDSSSYVLSDEAYRGLYIHEGETVPSVIDVYEKGIATGSFSKPISLTGLRLGWITSNSEVIYRCKLHRDYTTISKGMIDESLGALAMENIAKILERNNSIIRSNHGKLNGWIEDEELIAWTPPRAGSVGFMKHHLDMPAKEICRDLIKEKSTFMVPGDCFEMPGYIRIGYGNSWNVLEEGLSRFSDYLADHKR
ncbi:MAG: aminotransferase class I/II-fold pyridoxal phosphate-dependent enzyme [Candidatus Bathyarchaeia archaeon]